MWNDAKYTKEQRIAKLVKIEMGGADYVDLWRLSGPSKASNRASIMREVTGEKTPQAKCGVHALTDALCALFCVSGSCENERSKALSEAVQYHSGGITD